ncbi:hypothetical protein ILUMI_14694 [Ignelater luminosus]|uniref:Uncharacterized protein n=1 Tax=Ignelater luminosus TaxID=2038154 RepID=A0A8K0G9T1_IGNLU|nr:hypothetical protein ILUMI_14694 [Ignelater luminosus]
MQKKIIDLNPLLLRDNFIEVEMNSSEYRDTETVFDSSNGMESSFKLLSSIEIDQNVASSSSAFTELKINSSEIKDSCVQTGKTLTHGTPRKLKLRSKIRTLQRKLLPVKSNNTHEITEEDLDLMVTSPSSPPAVHIDVVDYHHWDNVTEQNGFEYVTGYLARKCCERPSCDLCIGYIFGSGVEIMNI